jgi:hypothetical protein
MGQMLVMTCGLGGVIRIGEVIRVVVQGQRNDRVAVRVTAPAGSELAFDGAVLSSLPMQAGRLSYYFSLLQVRRFCIDDVQVMVWLPGEAVQMAADCCDYVHVGIAAPGGLCVSYEHAGCDSDIRRAGARHLCN